MTMTEDSRNLLVPPDATPELWAALVRVQARIQTVRKGETAKVTSDRTGKSYTYQYADLADVVEEAGPIVAEEGLAVVFLPSTGPVIRYVLAHAESGQTITGEFDVSPYLPERASMQDLGGAITYIRRYIYCALLNIAPKGDDTDADGIPPRGAARTSGGNEPSPAQRNRLGQEMRKRGAPLPADVISRLLVKADAPGARGEITGDDVEKGGWVDKLDKREMSRLIEVLASGDPLPTGKSDIPSDMEAAPPAPGGDPAPFEGDVADDGRTDVYGSLDAPPEREAPGA